jgi:hypothetical protein
MMLKNFKYELVIGIGKRHYFETKEEGTAGD